MRTTFGSAGSSRVKNTSLSVLAVLLFTAALVCVIIALVRSPDAPDNGGSSASQNKDPDNGDSKLPTTPTGSIKSISEYTLNVTYTDDSGNADIDTVVDALLRQLISDASASEDTAYTVNAIKSLTPAVFNYTQDTSSICGAPLSANVWFVSSRAQVEYTGNLNADASGDVFLGGRYVVKTGSTYTLYEQAVYEAMEPEEIPTFVWGEYDASTTIGKEEMTLSCGVKLGMTYEAVETKMGTFAAVDTSASRVKTAQKAGYTFTFTLIDDSNNSADDYGLPHDGNYYLTYVTADSTCADEFPRGIKIGDNITDVFTKFPTANTKLQKWAEQRLYGAYENTSGKVYCFMEYRTLLASYRIVAQDTGREHIAIVFTKGGGEDPTQINVDSFEWYLE